MDTARSTATVESTPRLRSCVPGGRIVQFPREQDLRALLLDLVVACLSPSSTWSESALTDELAEVSDDPVSLRRELVDTQRLEREPDGSLYQLTQEPE